MKTIWSFGGGKGGVGKSVATANIGCALAKRGRSVILVDADLGGANLHTYFGIKFPRTTLEDFVKGRLSSLEDAAIDTPLEGLRLISGGGEFLGIANPAYAQKEKLIRHIKSLAADYILVDLGAGSSYNVLDFFAISTRGVVVLVPEPAAIQNAYIFLKSFVYRRLSRLYHSNRLVSGIIAEATDAHGKSPARSFSDLCERIAAEDVCAAERAVAEIKSYRPKILLNMAASREDERVVEAFKGAALTFLGLETDYIGCIPSRPSIKAAARKMRPFVLDDAARDAAGDVEAVVDRLILSSVAEEPQAEAYAAAAEDEPGAQDGPERPRAAPPADALEAEQAQGAGDDESDVFGFNDNVSHNGTVFHVQTEVAGWPEPVIDTVIYHGGRIFFSKRARWAELRAAAGAMGLKEFSVRQHRAAIAAVKLNKITIQGGRT